MRGVSTNYSGRQLDVELLQRVSEPTDRRVRPSVDAVDERGPAAVSGMQKVVQRYAALLLTELGSVKGAPGIGGDLMKLVRTGTMSSEAYLRFMVEVSSNNAVWAMVEDDNDEDRFGRAPDDERITAADVVSIDVDYGTGSAKVVVRISTVAGSDYLFLVPVAPGGA